MTRSGREDAALATARPVADRWRGKRVVVLGDALLDGWLIGSAVKLCREAPAPVVEVASVEYACGGAANTAANLAALGAAPTLVGVVGDDPAGARLRERIASAGVRDRLVTVHDRRTVTKRRLVADRHIVARIDDGDTDPVPAAVTRELCLRLARTTAPIVVCDYDAGTLTTEIVEWLARRRPRVPLLTVDAHRPGRWRATRPSVVTPNYAETCGLLAEVPPIPADGSDTDPVGFVVDRAERILELTGARNVAVTLDVHGSVLLGDGRVPHRTLAAPVPSSRTAGAGDAYTAALTLALLTGAAGPLAADLGQRAADTAISRQGTAVCALADLLTEPPAHAERPAQGEPPGHAEPAAHRRPAARHVRQTPTPAAFSVP